MCKERAGGKRRIFTFEAINQTVIVDDGFFRRFMDKRIGLFKPGVIVVERFVLTFKLADHRNRGDLHRLGQVFCDKVFVEISCLELARVDFLRFAQQSADNHRG